MRRRSFAFSMATIMAACLYSRPALAQKDVLDNIILLGPLETLKTPGIETAEERPEAKEPTAKIVSKLNAKSYHRPFGGRETPEDVYLLLESETLLSARSGIFRAMPRRLVRNAAGSNLASPFEKSPGLGVGNGSQPGSIETIDADDPGPAGGLTLDAAIARLVHANRDLATKYHEIPQADADELTAGLRENPLIFFTAGSTPYGRYSNQPGVRSYPIVITYLLDLTGRRQARIRIAREVRRLVEARYQDEVRLKIDELQSAFIDALAARASIRAVRESRDRLNALIRIVEARQGTAREARGLRHERDLTEIALDEAESRRQQALRDLTSLLDLPRGSEKRLELRGSLRSSGPYPPPVEDLIAVALRCRPDRFAQSIAVRRSQAFERLEESRRIRDTYILYEPWNYEVGQTNQGERGVNTWGLGLFVPLPLFDRNQGNIRRARIEISKMRHEEGTIERRVVDEVEAAAEEYESSRKAVERLEREMLPSSRQDRDEAWTRLRKGLDGVDSYLAAQRSYNTAARLHRDAIVRHRHASARINTVVGHRILP